MTIKIPYELNTGLVAALWRFVEDSGTTEEFFELRSRVREHGALYDSAPALLKALETIAIAAQNNADHTERSQSGKNEKKLWTALAHEARAAADQARRAA